MKRRSRKSTVAVSEKLAPRTGYNDILASVVDVLESARRTSARVVNAIMTAAYWEVGRRIVEYEQGGSERADYGQQLTKRLASDLTGRFGRGFGHVNLSHMRRFYLAWPDEHIFQTPSEKSAISLVTLAPRFSLPWSHYVRLLKVKKPEARRFYETEALRGGWSVRQLDRQISTLFYERTLASRNKRAMLRKGSVPRSDEQPAPEDEIKDPFVLEFLGLKDEYSETDLEEALIRQLEMFLLELGGDFTFVGRQKRLRVGDEWYRVDLLFFHRGLRCLVVIDLKLGRFTHADVGQMLLYLGYAAEHWMRPGENPPVGLILCAEHNRSVARYTLDRLPDKVLAAEYRMALPAEETLAAELQKTQAAMEQREINRRRRSPRSDKRKR